MTPLITTLTVHSADAASTSFARQHRRAYVSPDLLRAHKLAAGDWVSLRPLIDAEEAIVAQLWPRVGVEDDAVMLSPLQVWNLQSVKVELYRFDATSSAGNLKSITLEEALPLARSNSKLIPTTGPEASERELEWLKGVLKETLVSMRYVHIGTRIYLGEPDSSQRIFVVKDVELAPKKKADSAELAQKMQDMGIRENGHAGRVVFDVDWKTVVAITGDRVKSGEKSAGIGAKQLDGPLPSYVNLYTPDQTSPSGYSQLGGLSAQIKLVKSMLELPLNHPSMFTLFGLTPPRGILLHGPPGTGKTALARAVASSTPGCSCIVVNGPELSSAFHGESEERLRGVFTEARKRSPCIVVIDEVDALCPRRDGDGGEVEKRVVATLLTLMDGMAASTEEKVFVIAATNRPNSVDPALRRPGIPDAVGRHEILDILLARMPHSLSLSDVSAIAARTHGYVGADLSSLVRESASAAIQRWHDDPSPSRSGAPCLTNADVLAILPTIRPSAMREVFVETPTVRWQDIGGQEEIKQKLRECVEWPLTHRDTFNRLGVEAPRGVLLYGPPGCSKTMTAKALATESGINFIAVKGPELLNKYVGESERAVREIFRKARAAAPSIVFFDEIDALGSSRSDDMSHNGVLTSLLNEMDGIEELSGVTVVAATNRPDVLDSALMRPGRLDRILFVGAPDLETRKDIFRIRFSTMAVEPGIDVDELAYLAEGCSGAEVASICQDAALTAMNEDLDAPFVKRSHLVHSATTVRRRITPAMIRFFDEWRDQCGVRSA